MTAASLGSFALGDIEPRLFRFAQGRCDVPAKSDRPTDAQTFANETQALFSTTSEDFGKFLLAGKEEV